MPKKVEGLQELLIEELQDVYDAEKQLVKALPKMAKAASDEELGNALREHLEVTKGQVQRIEQVFEALETRAKSKPCKGMKGLVEEGSEMIQEDLEEGLMDSAIIGAGRKVEHYEMVAYNGLSEMAREIGRRDVAQLLQETMREEMEADKTLAQISKRLLKEASSRARMQGQTEDRTSSSRSKSRSSSARGSGRYSSNRSSSSRSASNRSSSNRSSSRSSGQSSRGSSRVTRVLTDPQEIQQWAEERGARPACVQGTGGKGDVGMIRLEFGGRYGNDAKLQEISWDDWSQRFEDRDLALIVEERTAGGQKSNFNKLVKRSTAGQKPRARAAR